MPALPFGHAGKYVAAAYIVFFALVLIYVSIMAVKLSRMERELAELNELADRRLESGSPAAPPASSHERTSPPDPTSRPEQPERTPTPAAGGPR
jgi:hypothetical protein